MSLIKPLVLLTMTNTIQFKCMRIEGVKNGIAVAISHF